jgi:hypothetical protein
LPIFIHQTLPAIAGDRHFVPLPAYGKLDYFVGRKSPQGDLRRLRKWLLAISDIAIIGHDVLCNSRIK